MMRPEVLSSWPRRRSVLHRILVFKAVQLLDRYERSSPAATVRPLESEFWSLHWALQRLDEAFA